jgi:hypothetical protein
MVTTTVRMGDWLQEQANRGHLLRSQVEAARLWASDLAELGTELRSTRVTREVRGGAADDIMRVATARRVAQAEAKLGGKGGPVYAAVHVVAVEGGSAGDVATRLEMRTTSAMDLIRWGLGQLVGVYQIRERRLTG